MPPSEVPPHGPVGIEKIWAYAGTAGLDFDDLADARDRDPQEIRDNLLVRKRTVLPLWEDAVTLAVNAAKPMISDEDREAIELVIVATESSVDQSKPISTWVHNHLGLKPTCRNYEAKHVCYGATNAMMMAAHWVISGMCPGGKALVIGTDFSRESIGEHYEYVMGGGAVALLISTEPKVLSLDLRHHGYITNDILDTFRPTSRVETGNNETSLYSYMDALEGAYNHFISKHGEVDIGEFFKWHIYHVPFGGITFQAHRTLLRNWKRLKKSQVWAHFDDKVRPSLTYNMQLGGTYSSSTFIALMGLLDSEERVGVGDRIGMFSYGSGSAGEFYVGTVGPEAKERIAAVELQQKIDARRKLSVSEYEKIERARFEAIDAGDFKPETGDPAGLWESHYDGQGLFVLDHIADHFREYRFS